MYNIYDLPSPISIHYLKRYVKFISAVNNVENVITECHHILPKSMGGIDDKSNLINLTPRQHYLAHWMLWKAYKSKEMTTAFFAMSNQNNQYQHRDLTLNSKTYEHLRLNFSMIISESSKELWQSKEYRSKHRSTNLTAKTKKLRSDKAKELWKDPEYREKLTDAKKKAWAEGRFMRDHSKCGSKGDKNVSKRPEVKAKNSGENHYSNREGYIKPVCPHCGISSTPTNIKRWHGDNCKMLIPSSVDFSIGPSNTINIRTDT
jgi:hypothetical protein